MEEAGRERQHQQQHGATQEPAGEGKTTRAATMVEIASATSVQRLLRKPGMVEDVLLLVPKQHDCNAVASSPTLPTSAHARITQLISDNAELFTEPSTLPPSRAQHDHTIEMEPGSKPPFRHPFRLSGEEKEELRKQLEQLLERDHIRPSKSPYGAPVLFVRKKDGSLRLCIDYRALNKQTVRDRYPLPHIEALLEDLQGATIFSKLDLRSGYHQVRVAETDVFKTAFTTHMGSFEWRVLPMGLTNAPATFQRLMNAVLGSGPFLKFCRIYLDDIIIFSKSVEEHEQHVQAVLRELRKNNLRLHPDKCLFGVREVHFLGHHISPGKISMESDKVAAILDWPFPQSRKQLQSFLGFANFYRAYLANYAHITAPLTDLLQKDTTTWKQEPPQAAREAFTKTKQAILAAPSLRMIDPSLPFIVYTDASDVAVAAVLHQRFADGEHPVGFASRKLSESERNFPARDKELLGMVVALEHWRHHLHGHRFTVRTDHQSLIHWQDMVLRSPSTTNKRIVRWAELLAEFHFDVQYIRGASNIADALTRNSSEAASISAMAVTVRGTDLASLIADSYYQGIVAVLEDKDKKHPHTERDKLRAQRFVLRDEALYFEDRTVEGAPRLRRCVAGLENQRALFHEYHNTATGGHQGGERTYVALTRHYFWRRMSKDVQGWTRQCSQCQRNKPDIQRTGTQPTQPLAIPTVPGEQISIDFMELPRTTNGHDNLFVTVDKLTKLVKIAACTKEIDAAQTADLLLSLTLPTYARLPSVIVSDRDPRFTSELWSNLWQRLGTRLAMTTAHRPQGDGQTERANRQIQEFLRNFVNVLGTDWDNIATLAQLEFALNSQRSSATESSAFELHLARAATPPAALGATPPPATTASTPPDLQTLEARWERAKEALREAQDKTASDAAPPPTRPSVVFKEGDQVLLHTRNYPSLKTHKLSSPFVGPFKILRMISPTVAQLDIPPNVATAKMHRNINIEQLKLFVPDTAAAPPPPPIQHSKNGVKKYIIDKIVGERTHYHRLQFKIKWKGYDDETWEPAALFLREFPILVGEWRKLQPPPKAQPPQNGSRARATTTGTPATTGAPPSAGPRTSGHPQRPVRACRQR